MNNDDLVLFLANFNASRDYFICHEILEDFWKKQDPKNKLSCFVGLIQLAVGQYHFRNSNLIGAKKMLTSSLKIFINNAVTLNTLGLDSSELIADVEKSIYLIENNKSFIDFTIKIFDKNLEKKVVSVCKREGWILGSNSNINDLTIVKKHTLRNRTEESESN